jgi:hypothetical protein
VQAELVDDINKHLLALVNDNMNAAEPRNFSVDFRCVVQVEQTRNKQKHDSGRSVGSSRFMDMGKGIVKHGDLVEHKM